MKMKVAGSSGTLELTYRTTWCHIIEQFQITQDLRISQWCLRGASPSGMMSCTVVKVKQCFGGMLANSDSTTQRHITQDGTF